MNINEKRIISYLIVGVPIALVLIASFFIISFYIDKVQTDFDSAKESSINEYIDSKKLESEIFVNKFNLLFEYKNSKIVEDEKLELKSSLDDAYKSVKNIYDKNSGKKSDREIKREIMNTLRGSVFITDFTGNNILSRDKNQTQKNISAFESADGRATVLEEIQKVRKYKEGYIVTTLYEGSGENLIAVKDMDMYSWYMGSLVNLDEKQKLLKATFLDMLSAIPLDDNAFIALYENNKTIFYSKNLQTQKSFIEKNLSKKTTWYEDKAKDYCYYGKYYAPFDWYLIYGFDIPK